jgi:uncharacterized membrane protein
LLDGLIWLPVAAFLFRHLQVPLFMRPPYGRHNAVVDATLASLGYVVVMWNAVRVLQFFSRM